MNKGKTMTKGVMGKKSGKVQFAILNSRSHWEANLGQKQEEREGVVKISRGKHFYLNDQSITRL